MNDTTNILRRADADAEALLGIVRMDQTQNGSTWNELGTWDFPAGWNRVAVSRWAPAGSARIAPLPAFMAAAGGFAVRG